MINRVRVLAVFTLQGILMAVFLASCGDPDDQGGQNAQVNPDGPRASQAVPVRVQELTMQSLELTTQATGVIRSRYEIPLSPEINGTVIGKLREIGDPVKSGEAIIQLDSEPYELALAQARAAYSSAQVAHEQAQRNFERARELRSTNDISEFELENSHLAEVTAQANLAMSGAALKLAQRNLRLTGLVSPIDGIVAQLDVQIGQQVAPGTSLGKVVSLRHLEIEVGLSEREIIPIKSGDDVHVSIDVFPDRQFTGKVRRVGLAGLDLGRTFPVIVDVDNSSGLLRPGMIASVRIIHTRCPNVLAVPRRALVIGADRPTLYIINNGIALERDVSLGAGDDEKIIVESGLAPGDTLIIEGQNVLRDSTRVKIL